MFKRFVSWVRSVFGGAISSLEDPALILEQNIRDMKDQVPKMNENIAMIKANVTLLEREMLKLDDQEKTLISNVKAAIQAGKDALAADYASSLEQVRSSKARAARQYEMAKKSFDKAMEVKKGFMKEIDRKSREAMMAIQEAKRAQWQKQVADTMESFEVGGIDQTHDEMINRINEESAISEARMDLALGKVDSERMKIEEDGEKMRAEELVKQFKIEMGMLDTPGETTSESQKEKA